LAFVDPKGAHYCLTIGAQTDLGVAGALAVQGFHEQERVFLETEGNSFLEKWQVL
jgi:hypothetical protein